MSQQLRALMVPSGAEKDRSKLISHLIIRRLLRGQYTTETRQHGLQHTQRAAGYSDPGCKYISNQNNVTN